MSNYWNNGYQDPPPRYHLEYVTGREGAMNFPMGPDSTILLPDKNEQKAWYVATDQLGRKTVCQDYDMIPCVHQEPPDPNELMNKLQAVLNQNEELAKKIRNMEEQLGVESAV